MLKRFNRSAKSRVMDALNSIDSKYITTARQMAAANGVLVLPSDHGTHGLTQHAPFTVHPSPIPRSEYDSVCLIQPDLNSLLSRIAFDDEFLRSTLSDVVEIDDFTRRLWAIYEDRLKLKRKAPAHLGILRSDYMLSGDLLRQVEVNTIASSFAGLAQRVSLLHRQMAVWAGRADLLPHIPDNTPCVMIAQAFLEAWAEYNNPRSVILFVVQPDERNVFDQRAIELEIMNLQNDIISKDCLHCNSIEFADLLKQSSDSHINSANDQDNHQSPTKKKRLDSYISAPLLSKSNWEDDSELTSSSFNPIPAPHTVKEQPDRQGREGLETLVRLRFATTHDPIVVWKTLAEVADEAVLDESGELTIDSRPVSLVYYRAGYAPTDYSTEREWRARRMLELSRAVQCPSVALQLAGTKKVQQKLCEPGILERFIAPEDAVERIRRCFASHYHLDMTPDGERNVQQALAKPDNLVLKPQREGGGNNHYGEDIVPVLRPIAQSRQRTEYILMERLRPPAFVNVALRAGSEPRLAPMVSELGIYGAILAFHDSSPSGCVFNRSGGHLLRSKAADTNEGGVAAGYAFIDSPLLC